MIAFKTLPNLGGTFDTRLTLNQILARPVMDVKVITYGVHQKQGGWAGRAVVGGVLLGGLGAVIGAATRKVDSNARVTFEITFADGGRYLTEADGDTFNRVYGHSITKAVREEPTDPTILWMRRIVIAIGLLALYWMAK